MGNTNMCCHNYNPEINKQKINEITSDRKEAIQKNKKANLKPPANKVITETDDNFGTSNFNGIHISNNKNNFNSYNKIIPNNINENETSERVQYLHTILDKSPKLNLEVINSNVLPQGLSLKLNALGLENSRRVKKDGFVYFGYQTDTGKPIVDYIIRPKDKDYDNRYIGRHFQILLNPEVMKYYIKDLGNGFGTFVKIQSDSLLKDNSLINIGDSYLVCTMGVEEDTIISEYASEHNIKIPSIGNKETTEMLNVKIFSGNEKYDPINFQPSKSVIKIGRSTECEITIEDNMLSRVHCTIEYQENVGWIIRDGYNIKTMTGSYEVKQSTNGTWIYAMEDTMIYDGMIFKANHNLFEVYIAVLKFLVPLLLICIKCYLRR